jgi:hypothetical protein
MPSGSAPTSISASISASNGGVTLLREQLILSGHVLFALGGP